MEREIGCFEAHKKETCKSTCFLVYFDNGARIPVAVFKNKEDAVAYCKNHDMIQFSYTSIWELPFNDEDYNF